MAKESTDEVGLAHGARRLPAVEVVSYNVELKDDEGFVGDRASKGAFQEFIENWRRPLRDMGEDHSGMFPATNLQRRSWMHCLSKASQRAPE
ncbi:MAG TPA: hypothetical protein VMV19_14075 [Xanthobacteraceae bacterium]|nr:hypothetical protein [Xanthobacteraceae bacterium]